MESIKLRYLVFCYKNCSDLLLEKFVLVIEKKLLKFKAEGREFSKILRSLEQFIQTVKGQNQGGESWKGFRQSVSAKKWLLWQQ